jgi:hypothetical protein
MGLEQDLRQAHSMKASQAPLLLNEAMAAPGERGEVAVEELVHACTQMIRRLTDAIYVLAREIDSLREKLDASG